MPLLKMFRWDVVEINRPAWCFDSEFICNPGVEAIGQTLCVRVSILFFCIIVRGRERERTETQVEICSSFWALICLCCEAKFKSWSNELEKSAFQKLQGIGDSLRKMEKFLTLIRWVNFYCSFLKAMRWKYKNRLWIPVMTFHSFSERRD